MQKKSLIKSRAATKKALIASRKGATGKVNAANVAAGVVAGSQARAGVVAGSQARAGVVAGSQARAGVVAGSQAQAGVVAGVRFASTANTGSITSASKIAE